MTKEEIIDLQYYIDALYEDTDFDTDAYNEVCKAIGKQMDKIRNNDNLIDYFDNLNNETP